MGIANRLRRGPWGLAGTVLAVLLVENALARHDLELTRPEATSLRMARSAARQYAPGCDVLFLGSSMAHEGLVPAVFERRLGTKSYNLSVVAGTTSTSYYLLREAIRAGARPSAVVLDVHPAMILSDNRDRNHYWADSIGMGELVDLAWTLGDAHVFADVALKKALRSLYHRDQLRSAVRGAMDGGVTTNWLANLGTIRNLRKNRGAYLLKGGPSYQGEIAPIYNSLWLHEGHRRGSSPSAELYMHRLLRLASDHGIQVYWLDLPLAAGLERQREAAGLNAAYDRFTRSFLSHPNLVVLDARRSGYGPEAFLDACHLNVNGASALSDAVAGVIARAKAGDGPPAGPRVEPVAAYRRRDVEFPFEDANESMAAVMKPDRSRREGVPASHDFRGLPVAIDWHGGPGR